MKTDEATGIWTLPGNDPSLLQHDVLNEGVCAMS